MADILDTEIVKHLLQFGEATPVEIAEPIKFDAANFVLDQHNKGYGRDVSFASGSVNLRFSPLVDIRGLDHRFTQLITEYKTNGFEADVKYILRVDNGTTETDYIIGQLDFEGADTDQLKYFDCQIIQENDQANIKRRKKVKVNVFSNQDVDGNPIDPVEIESIYLKATPISKCSKWVIDEPRTYPGASPSIFFNPAIEIEKAEFEGTISPFPGWMQLSDTENPVLRDFKILEADTKIVGSTLKVRGNWNFTGTVAFVLRIKKGFDFESSEYIYLQDMNVVETNFELDLEIPIIEKGEKIFLYFNAQALSAITFTMTDFNVELVGLSQDISSTITVVNLGKAMQQVVKAISGLEIEAPRFLTGGQFEKQYITNGLLMRNITDEPFYLSLEQLVNQMAEWRGDYEVTEDGVFFGLYDDFYTDNKVGEFDLEPDETFKTSFNEKYAVNTLGMKYAKYEKDNDQDGSRDGAHTELQLLFPNKMVENDKDIKIPFIRDRYLIESNRRKAIEVTEETATENDEDIFIIDTIEENVAVSETFALNHKIVDVTYLKLLNDGSFNWLFMGFQVNDFITLAGENAGTWRIGTIEPTILHLIAVGASQATFEGLDATTISYTVSVTDLTNRTDEGFDIITGTDNPEGFTNLNFTLKRNLINYYSKYILTACHFRQQENVKVTEYIHNGGLRTQKAGETELLQEDADIDLAELALLGLPLVTPFMVKTRVICDFTTFFALRSKMRDSENGRGYVNIKTTEGVTVKVFPKMLNFKWQINYLEITGELGRT